MLILLDVVIAILLFTIPIVVFERKRKKKVDGNKFYTLKQILSSNKIDITISVLIGIFFAFSYFPFRYMHTPWKMFGFLHVYIIVAGFALPFALAYLVKGTSKARLVAIIMSGILIISPLTRPIFMPMVREMKNIASWDMAIPFNLCNISALIYIFGVLFKNKIIHNYMITFGLFGGLINNIQAHNISRGTFWFYLTAESYFVHILIIVIPIFMLLTNQIKPQKKAALINALWIFPFYFLAGFLINPAWKTNFHFTKPIAFTEGLIPTMKSPLLIFGEAVDPLYVTIMAIVVSAACILLYLLSVFIHKRLAPKFSNIN